MYFMSFLYYEHFCKNAVFVCKVRFKFQMFTNLNCQSAFIESFIRFVIVLYNMEILCKVGMYILHFVLVYFCVNHTASL